MLKMVEIQIGWDIVRICGIEPLPETLFSNLLNHDRENLHISNLDHLI